MDGAYGRNGGVGRALRLDHQLGVVNRWKTGGVGGKPLLRGCVGVEETIGERVRAERLF